METIRKTSWRKRAISRRGMALLLVLVGMIVCTILTAGFLSSQGTSIGIARNERDATKSRGIAQTGIDMCYWLIRNKSDWRTTMTPGKWLNNVAIGDGTVTVNVADGDNTNNFADDTTQSVILSSTGTYDGRAFTLTASIRPTGGGTVFANGNFVSGTISVGNGDLLTASTVDSYNSSVAAYNPLAPGSNANFISDSVANNSLLVYFPSVFRGSYTAGPTAVLSNVLGLLGLASGPSSVSALTETRNPGTVVFPNTTGLIYRNAYSWVNKGSNTNLGTPGRFDSFTVTNDGVTITTSGIYYITGNLTVGSSLGTFLTIQDGVNAVFVVDGNLALTTGKINLGGTSQAAFYVNGNITVDKGLFNSGGTTSRLSIFGGSGGGTIQIINSNAVICGSIYAPQHTFKMQNGSPKFYGAVVAQSLTLKDSSALHFDEALKALKISNITGGSASPGVADYRISITGGPGIQR